MVGVSYGIAVLTAKDPPTNNLEPDSDINAPTAVEGKPVPVLFGTKRIKGPNVVWYGDLKSIAIKK